MYDHSYILTNEVQGHIYHEKLNHSSTKYPIHLETQVMSENMSYQAPPGKPKKTERRHQQDFQDFLCAKYDQSNG